MPGKFLLYLWISTIMSTTNVGVAQEITSPSPDSLQKLCPGEEVVITCVTRGSSIIAWRSKEYIGIDGTRLEFATFNNVGDIQRSPNNHNIFAKLTRKTLSGSVLVFESQLHIIVSEATTTSTVTCIHVSDGTSSAISIKTLTRTGIPSEIVSSQTLGAAGRCSIHISWILPKNTNIVDVSHFAISVDGTNIANETNNFNQTLNMAVYSLCSCASHNISISAVNRCGSVGESSTNITLTTLLTSPVLDIDCLTNTMPTDCQTGGSNKIGGTSISLIIIVVAIIISIL